MLMEPEDQQLLLHNKYMCTSVIRGEAQCVCVCVCDTDECVCSVVVQFNVSFYCFLLFYIVKQIHNII